MIKKKALVFGINKQNGTSLAKHLVEKKYAVYGISEDKKFNEKKIISLLKKNFDEIYYLSDQRNTKNSDIYSNLINSIKVILDHIVLQKGKKSRLLFEGSKKMYSNMNFKKNTSKENKNKPASPYGLSKFIGYEIIKSYRKMFSIPVCTAIIFNCEFSNISKGFHKILNQKKIEDYMIVPGTKVLLKKI